MFVGLPLCSKIIDVNPRIYPERAKIELQKKIFDDDNNIKKFYVSNAH